MVFELHVWGPSFSLPSIDAQCLATIAYLSQTVPRGEWLLIPSSDPTLSPNNELPALRNGDIWIGGFRNIIQYISEYSGGKWVLDDGLEGLQRADCAAFSSFIQSQGQPLLDLSLYVSSLNYSKITRPLYSTLQPFPLQYITPPTIRSIAKARTAHLGLSSLDIDPEDGEISTDNSIIPERLRKPRETVSSLLNSLPENKSQIRLHGLATVFFEPLQALKGRKRFFLSNDTLTTLDCLALAYLSLCLLPDLPQPWLSRCMRQDFPQLSAYVHDLQELVFSERNSDSPALPWSEPTSGNFIRVGSIFLSSIADKIPGIRQLRLPAIKDDSSKYRTPKTDEFGPDFDSASSSMVILESPQKSIDEQKDMYLTLGSMVVGVGLLVGFFYRHELLKK